jgi:hypothetical protein
LIGLSAAQKLRFLQFTELKRINLELNKYPGSGKIAEKEQLFAL